MIVPSKFTSLDQSILGKLDHLFVEGVDEISIPDLMNLRLKKFSDIGEFMIALDTLFVLGRIELNGKTGVLKYVG